MNLWSIPHESRVHSGEEFFLTTEMATIWESEWIADSNDKFMFIGFMDPLNHILLLLIDR